MDSDDIAERETFIALAGSDNGAAVFRMLSDRHNLLNNRQVVKVWLYGKNRGQCSVDAFCKPAIVACCLSLTHFLRTRVSMCFWAKVEFSGECAD